MAQNFPGPYAVEIEYDVDDVSHKMTLNCDVTGSPAPGDIPSSISLVTRDGVGAQLDLAVNAFAALWMPNLNNANSTRAYTLWKYTPLSTERQFITTDTLTVSGGASGGTVLAHQSTLTFRTQEGNGMRIVILEDALTFNTRSPLASPDVTNYNALRDFIVSDSNWVLARDTSYPIAALNLTGGQNERVFKVRYR